MLTPIRHRGPDGEGIHLDGSVGLGHVRLAIIDLHTGAQPMCNEDESVWIVFNGEIYNFPDLRARLLSAGHTFRSHTDTEVILHLYEDLGTDCIKELRGMFAFAIWDARQRKLVLARDRLGIKPLYYCNTGRALLFASEIKSLAADEDVPLEPDLAAFRTFLSFHYTPGEQTPLRQIRKLLPGHFLVADEDGCSTQRYWDLDFSVDPCSAGFEESADRLHALLTNTVKDHMIADVPVGVLLSGGVDSTAMLSFATKSAEKTIQTFTVGFAGEAVVDERPYARIAVERFKTDHHEISITADDFWEFLPSYIWHMEELVYEPPAVALYYVSRLARKHVKVLLSGEGGDEAFAGYPNYPRTLSLAKLARPFGPLAGPLGSTAGWLAEQLGAGRYAGYGRTFGRQLSEYYFSRTSTPLSYFNRSAAKLLTREFQASAPDHWAADHVSALLRDTQQDSLLNQMLYVDSKTWLPDDLLVKADKMTMANSVELRVPLLDHKLIEFAAALPTSYKVQGRETKRLLKAALVREVPAPILKRKKAGFPLPFQKWMRGELRSKAEDVLLSAEADRGYFQRNEVRRLLQENAAHGQYNREIFCLLLIELWHRSPLLRRPAVLR